MRVTVVTELNRPRADVFRAYTNPDHLKAWQKNLVDIEPLSGTPGQPGAEARLTYQEEQGPVTLTATVVERQEPELYAVLSVGRYMTLAATSRFRDLGGGWTEWELDTETRFTGWRYWLLGPILRPVIRVGLEQRLTENAGRFKRKLEAGEFDG